MRVTETLYLFGDTERRPGKLIEYEVRYCFLHALDNRAPSDPVQPADTKPMAQLGLVLFPSLTTIRPVAASRYLRGILAPLT